MIKINIDFNKIYHSNNSGDFVILEDLGRINNVRRIKVRFIETGFEKDVRYQDAMNGEIKDPTNYKSINIDNTIYTNNNGCAFNIIRDCGTNKYGSRLVEIKFIETGYTNIVLLNSVKNGAVKDPFHISVYGVGYLGNADTIDPVDRMLYKIWCGMLSRCYNTNDRQFNNYGGVGVTVDARWHCFEYYLNDVKLLPGFKNKLENKYGYQLDKDYLQRDIPYNKRVYSKDTCIWLSVRDNINMRTIDNSGDKLIGVYKSGNIYTSTIYINNEQYIIGIFDDPIAAANAYNIYSMEINMNNLIQLINDVPYMHPTDILKHNLHPKVMCKIVDS